MLLAQLLPVASSLLRNHRYSTCDGLLRCALQVCCRSVKDFVRRRRWIRTRVPLDSPEARQAGLGAAPVTFDGPLPALALPGRDGGRRQPAASA